MSEDCFFAVSLGEGTAAGHVGMADKEKEPADADTSSERKKGFHPRKMNIEGKKQWPFQCSLYVFVSR